MLTIVALGGLLYPRHEVTREMRRIEKIQSYKSFCHTAVEKIAWVSDGKLPLKMVTKNSQCWHFAYGYKPRCATHNVREIAR